MVGLVIVEIKTPVSESERTREETDTRRGSETLMGQFG